MRRTSNKRRGLYSVTLKKQMLKPRNIFMTEEASNFHDATFKLGDAQETGRVYRGGRV